MVDPITALNFVLCVVIFALGITVYVKKKDAVALYVSVAFGLFGVSHFTNLVGVGETLTTALIIIRTVGYLIVIFALLKRSKP